MSVRSVAPLGLLLFAALLACKKGSDEGSTTDEKAKPEEKAEEPAKKAEEPKVKPCPANWIAAESALSATGALECQCEAAQVTGSVWGTKVYTSDSSICAAAVHAGAIPRTGGTVKAQKTPDCKSYSGSAANGVTTSNWGPYDKGTFFFPGYGDGKCAAAGEACPRAFVQIPGYSRDTSLTCDCTPAAMTGVVWGSDIYTVDSSICAAARHVGAVPAEGGPVTVKGAYGCGSYKGSVRNGVKTDRWGRYALSFYFDGHGDGVCR